MIQKQVDFSALPIGELPITDFLHVKYEIERQRLAEKKIRLTNRYLRQYQREYYLKRIKQRTDEAFK